MSLSGATHCKSVVWMDAVVAGLGGEAARRLGRSDASFHETLAKVGEILVGEPLPNNPPWQDGLEAIEPLILHLSRPGACSW